MYSSLREFFGRGMPYPGGLLPDRLVSAAAESQCNIPLFFYKPAVHNRIKVVQNFVMCDFLKLIAGKAPEILLRSEFFDELCDGCNDWNVMRAEWFPAGKGKTSAVWLIHLGP